MEKEKKPKIVASLRYGRLISGWLLGLFIFSCVLDVGGILFSIIIYTLIRLGIIPPDEDEIILLYFGIVFVLCLALSLFFLIRRAMLKKKMMLWRQDAVYLTAHSKTLGVKNNPPALPAYAIEIDFVYNERLIIKRSGNPEKPKSGYDPIFGHYANREIKILYSPSYDQVMILKDKRK